MLTWPTPEIKHKTTLPQPLFPDGNQFRRPWPPRAPPSDIGLRKPIVLTERVLNDLMKCAMVAAVGR